MNGPESHDDRSVSLWWVRRDLRLSDNRALDSAVRRGGTVVPLFIVDPSLMDRPAPLRKGFLWSGLRQLDADLGVLGSRLIVRRGEPVEVLAQVMTETGANAVFAEEDYAPYPIERDSRAARRLPIHFVPGPTMRHPDAVLKASGTPYTVFTPYSRAWNSLPLPGADTPLPAPRRLPAVPAGLPSLEMPETAAPTDFPAGEREALRRLDAFTASASPPIWEYADLRDRVDLAGTSALSPYLRFGMVSTRQAFVATAGALDRAPETAARAGIESWLNELIWREFYTATLFHFPYVLEQAFRANLRTISWDNDEGAFAAWCTGETGYPIVDAAMRQLRQTGWMHNRARMIVASFLVKDLLIDWQWGERWFMEWLVDGDPAANNGGWQWTAGVGTDAAPYFRIFNPVLQGQKFDPHGDFVRQWLPELAQVPAPFIHEPWRMPVRAQHDAGCVIGRDYPPPVIDHAAARERTLAAYAATR